MDPLIFCYGLQGFVELNAGAPSSEQWTAIREHLQTVFQKTTTTNVVSVPPLLPPPFGPETLRPDTLKPIC